MGTPVIIPNPIINSPFAEPVRHFKFDDDGITDQILEKRRESIYFIPIAQPKKKGKQQTISDWTADRIEENKTVNAIRQRVKLWREGGYPDVTRTTARLLAHWNSPDRVRRLFFCQVEALETVIYISEVAKKYGDAWIDNDLRQFAANANPELFRVACKMATGSGKTAVMAMIIAWQTLNKLASPQDARFTDAFLVVAPGITIKDRLRVLLPSDTENYYAGLDIVPSDLRPDLDRAKIIITNYHGFRRREKIDAGKLTKSLLAEPGATESPFVESEGEMVRRVCRGLGNKKNILVLNDEAHHCYRRKPVAEAEAVADESLTGEERREAAKRNEEAAVWISGIEAIKRKIGVKTVYDVSATPFFLSGSGYGEGKLFPWVVSDFSLIDAIESGIVKVPRVPISDDSMDGDVPTYRDLWLRIRDGLPKKKKGEETLGGEPKPPAELEGALTSLYENYKQYHQRWEKNVEARENGQTPPVFIVVCNNTNVSKMVFDYVSGWEKTLTDGRVVAVPGKLPLFSNVESAGGATRFLDRPNTILVDSQQLESGEGMSDEFKKIASREIEEFKNEYRARFPGRDTDNLTDEDILREVMNTVGKKGKLGENVRCVVSVSMLTEGWDANTVTHVLGVRAFGTQLLCEQVVGRALRRMSYAATTRTLETPSGPKEIESFAVEYAEVYGVPFSFIASNGRAEDAKPGPIPTRVRALPERLASQITFPRLDGYRYELPAERLERAFTDASKLTLSSQQVPTKVENAPIVGETAIHTLDELKKRRPQEVAFHIARQVMTHYFGDSDATPEELKGQSRPWLFPDLLAISSQWLKECVVLKDNAFPQLLLLAEYRQDAADRIYKAIVHASGGEKRLLPILKPYDPVGSTSGVSFDTVKPTYRTRAEKCHISHVVADTGSWEQKLAQTLEDMPEVVSYVKNQNLGFFIPYQVNGQQRNYIPDFIVRMDDGHGPLPDGSPDLLNLVIEVTGEKDKDKEAKVSTAETLWVPAVNNAGTFGRWHFLEIQDPWKAATAIRRSLEALQVGG